MPTEIRDRVRSSFSTALAFGFAFIMTGRIMSCGCGTFSLWRLNHCNSMITGWSLNVNGTKPVSLKVRAGDAPIVGS
jgi:hypothetical protein